ncbi:hypothetical protein RM550_34700 [Streptomyces sp. DSM 41527]|uniref:Uncharacterized protein n=1 Tax=Streptomyces mooreae TaxID=3075523 RepID=A0ABU2TIQ1_9ACTN|nr:hypothetical protein [Streptomyces sp. DSM 41527]MDT0460813.1 hypothetical protein [Streptomyces sp. DSM 41527]
MPQSMALAKGARITGGVFCLLFFLFTAYWLAADAGEFGLGGLWQAWARQRAGLNQATTPFHVGLAAVQLTAALAAFAGRRVAGGLLAVATTLTFATATQAALSTGLHTSDNRWYLHADIDATPFEGVFLSSVCLFLLSVAACAVLLAGMRSWPRRTPTDPPKRPARTAGLAAGLLLGVMVLWNLAWQGYILVQSDAASLPVFYLGKGILSALLSMAPGWSALVFLALTSVAMLSSLMRGAAARGLACGLAVQALPGALVTVIGPAGNGTLFDGASTPGLTVIGDVGLLLDLFGSAALLALTVRGEPVAPAWFAPAAGPQFAAPGFAAPAGPQAPQPGLQAPQAGPPSWQPPVGGPVAPVSGPPVPPPGIPPMPPGTPPPPQGGFGPPQY